MSDKCSTSLFHSDTSFHSLVLNFHHSVQAAQERPWHAHAAAKRSKLLSLSQDARTRPTGNLFRMFSHRQRSQSLLSRTMRDFRVLNFHAFFSRSQMLNLCLVYYLSKLTEFADTVFFVLRKKKSQITWLHLYHHSLTPMEAWLLVKFISGIYN